MNMVVERLIRRTDELHTLVLGSRKLVLAPRYGARIVSLTLAGEEMLTQPQAHPDNFGSTFWDAPQAAWGWPPRAALDSQAYSARIEGRALVAQSRPDPDSGLICIKRFAVDREQSCFDIEYSLLNGGGEAISVAPWELTRMPGGLSFFPVAAEAAPESTLNPTLEADGLCWYDFDAADLAVGRKLFRSGREGWLAHVCRGGQLLVKQFPATPASFCAPGHGSVELWGEDGGPYMELENHGAYQRLEAGESLCYPVRWYVERVPPAIAIRAGNPELAAFVRGLLAENRAASLKQNTRVP